jgi:hypothetical protein
VVFIAGFELAIVDLFRVAGVRCVMLCVCVCVCVYACRRCEYVLVVVVVSVVWCVCVSA